MSKKQEAKGGVSCLDKVELISGYLYLKPGTKTTHPLSQMLVQLVPVWADSRACESLPSYFLLLLFTTWRS